MHNPNGKSHSGHKCASTNVEQSNVWSQRIVALATASYWRDAQPGMQRALKPGPGTTARWERSSAARLLRHLSLDALEQACRLGLLHDLLRQARPQISASHILERKMPTRGLHGSRYNRQLCSCKHV